MKRLLCFTAPLLAAVCSADESVADVSVSGVSISQNPVTHLVTVSYTLGEKPAIVTVDFLTNGVSIGEKNFNDVFGAVNRLVVQTGAVHTIHWQPRKSWPGNSGAELSAKVSAWRPEAPPDYLVVSLDGDVSVHPRSYYVSTNALPGGIESDIYRTSRLVMRRIPAAGVTWQMGNPGTEKDTGEYETPHNVTFTEDYFLGVFEMTQEQHRMFSGQEYTERSDYGKTREEIAVSPKVNIEYRFLRGNAAPVDKYRTFGVDRCDFKTLREKTGIDFDLPSDAQWEYAARAGGTSLMWGDTAWNVDIFKNHEWYYSNSKKHTEANGYPGGDDYQHGHRVGSKLPNPFGLYDMLGNVCEICLDAYTADLGTAGVQDPVVSSGSNRVRRGGNFNNASGTANVRATYRTSIAVNSSDFKIGYRLMCPVTLKFPVEETSDPETEEEASE